MRTMIHQKMAEVFNDFQGDISGLKLCDLKTIRFDGLHSPDYTKRILQQLYLLRYFPAYLCEYTYLYDRIEAAGKIARYCILSVGCGSCVDYYAACLAVKQNVNRIIYHGIDPVQWQYVDALGNPDFQFVLGDIGDMDFPQAVDYNVIFFPKSLAEIGGHELTRFLSKIVKCNFTSKCVFLVSSIMDKGYLFDSQLYQEVADILVKKGFQCKNFQTPHIIANKVIALNKIYPAFDYPNSVKSFIATLSRQCKSYKKNGKCCQIDCIGQLDKQPILTSKHICFQFNLFEK